MRPFNILDREVSLEQNLLLEASAGTGKTFSIEHLVVRLLITGKNPPSLSQLLAVTFTRAATRDLKMRIRQNIETALNHLQSRSSSFDYLIALLEESEERRKCAEKRLENALYCFDQAQIYTIHGFCLRMLKDHGFTANVRVDLPESENPLSQAEVLEVIKDYLRTDFNEENYSLAQMQVILNSFQNSVELFQKKLLTLLMNHKEIEKQLPYSESYSLFQKRMEQLKKEGFTAEEVYQQIPHYKGVCDRSGKIKPETEKKIERFTSLFEKDHWTKNDFEALILDQLSILKLFSKSKLKAKQTHGSFFRRLKELIYPLISERVILAKMASDCQLKFYDYLERTEKYRFDDLLEMMKTALNHPPFKERIQAQFRVAIIDEFQDTDPVQWEIFRALFLISGHFLYLVGDPKQSIYSFRQADIYTYLRAGKDIGEEQRASLTTNYRSQPSLIKALNALFSKPDFLSLPKVKSSLPYIEINPSPKAVDYPFKDEKGSVHFAFAEFSGKYSLEQLEQKEFFPFIVEEIQRLIKEERFSYSQVAILVSDRFQALRLLTYLQKWGIPAVNQKQKSLLDSPAYSLMKDLIQAVLNPKDPSSIKVALGGALFAWSHDRIRDGEEQLPLEVMRFFYQQYQLLLDEGFASFFRQLLNASPFGAEKTLSEQLLSREEGAELYGDIYQFAELLIESQARPEQLLQTLEELPLKELDEDASIQKQSASNTNSVKLLTIHSSKGLEFDIVVALGLVKRMKISESFIPVEREGSAKIIPVVDEESEPYISYCEELSAEKMRQLYVALTRAKYRVYLPVALPTSEALFNNSPMDLFMSYLNIASLEQLANGKEISCSKLKGNYHLEMSGNDQKTVELFPPEKINTDFPSKKIASFTALAKPLDHSGREKQNLDFAGIRTAHNLPAGSHTGNMLHTLLEKLPLSQAFEWGVEEFKRFLSPYVYQTPFQEWEDVLSEMLYNTFHAPLTDTFALKDIDPNQAYREMEFLYSEDKEFPYFTHMKGFVDLIFQHENRYYLLDWKSNWLGESDDSYQRPQLEKCMSEHDYFLQARIYTKALKRYFSLVDERPFEEIFGGVFYVFLRGVHPHKKGSGFFHFIP